MVFSQDVCTLRWTYNKVIKPDRGNTFSLWPSPCQQIPFSAHFRAPWKNHYQSLTIELPFLNLAPLNVQMLFSLYCEILFTWAPIILFCCCWSLYWICYNTASIYAFVFGFFFFFWLRGMQELTSLIRDRTRNPSTAKQHLNNWTTREVLLSILVYGNSDSDGLICIFF